MNFTADIIIDAYNKGYAEGAEALAAISSEIDNLDFHYFNHKEYYLADEVITIVERHLGEDERKSKNYDVTAI